MKTSREKIVLGTRHFYLRALNLRKYLMYVPVNKVWLYWAMSFADVLMAWRNLRNVFNAALQLLSRGQPIILNPFCTVYIVRCSLGLVLNPSYLEIVQRRYFPTRIQWGLARLRPTISIVMSEDELAWKWAALLVDGRHSGSDLLQASTSLCKGLFLSTVISDVVSSP
mgnify:CR=1